MTTVNSRLVNLRHPSSSMEYTLDRFVSDSNIIPINVFDSLDEAKVFLKGHRTGIVSFPRMSTYNDTKYMAYMKATPDPLGVVVLNVMTYSDHMPSSKNDVRPVDGGDWVRGDVVVNVDSTERFSPISWVCTEGGMPGTWLVQGFTKANYSDLQVVDELPGAEEYNEGRLVLHRVSNQLSEICYCAKVSDNGYEWKSILAYEVEHPPDEEDLVDKFLAWSFPLGRMGEFGKDRGPDLSKVYDLRDRLITAEDLVEYDRLIATKSPAYTSDASYMVGRRIEPTDDVDSLVSGVYYCPYDFSTYDDGTRPNGYPPTDHPVYLTSRQFERVAADVSETMVLQKATDEMTGETYSRCGRVIDGRFSRDVSDVDDPALVEWHQNGNATPIADIEELLSIIEGLG